MGGGGRCGDKKAPHTSFSPVTSTNFGHMTKIKTSLNILLRIIEHNNRLPDHLTMAFLLQNIVE